MGNSLRTKKKSSHSLVTVSGPDQNDSATWGDPFFIIPLDVVTLILKHLSYEELMVCMLVSRRWRSAVFAPVLWGTEEGLLKRPEKVTDGQLLGYIYNQPDRSVWNFKCCERLTDLSMMHLTSYCKSLTSLGIDHCRHITDNGIEKLSNKFSNTLTHLTLAWIKLTNKGVSIIGNKMINLKYLYMKGNNIYITDVSPIGNLVKLESLSLLVEPGVASQYDISPLSTLTNLKSLSLTHLHPKELNMLPEIMGGKMINELILYRSSLNDEFMSNLTNVAKHLKKLHLYHPSIQTSAVQILSNQLKDESGIKLSLTHLSMNCISWISQDLLQALTDMMKYLPELEYLDIGQNVLSQNCIIELCKSISVNCRNIKEIRLTSALQISDPSPIKLMIQSIINHDIVIEL